MKRLVATLFCLFFAASASAAEKVPAELEAFLTRIVPGQAPDSIEATPMPGIYQVIYGSDLFYFSENGRYMLRGDLVDLKTGINLSEMTRATARKSALEQFGKGDMIVYPAQGGTKHVVTVFTDVDCPYCRKLHSGMAEMNAMGIEVRYLGFPRAGEGSATYKKMAAIWCADDRRQAMDDAKAGKSPASNDCDYSFTEQMALVRAFGVTGTPALVLEDGRLVSGYMPPKQLLAALEQAKAERAKP